MPVNVSNTAEISFGTPTANGDTPSEIVLREGTNFRQVIDISNTPGAVQANREVVFAVGALDINFASSTNGLTDANLARVLNGYFGDTALTATLHDGDPGAAFTANQMSGTNGITTPTIAAGNLTATVT